MGIFRRIFDLYLHGSIHVALAVASLVLMTQQMFRIPDGSHVALFGFFGTIAGYNFVKYDALLRVGKKTVRNEVKAITVLSFLSFLGAVYCFLQLSRVTQLVSIAILALTALYTLPFFPDRKNARNWAGVKIYIVSLCWAGVTVILPILDSGIPLSFDIVLKCIQRFVLVFVLILIFEIVDLPKDDPHLKTVPQSIGVRKTKITGILLLLVFLAMEFFYRNPSLRQLQINGVLAGLAALFLVFASPFRSRYYTAFWVESLPVVWWLLAIFAQDN